MLDFIFNLRYNLDHSNKAREGVKIMTKKCKSCVKDIDINAKKCPYCQADQRGWFKKHPILTGIFGLIVLFSIIGMAGGKGGSSSTNSDNGSHDISTNATQAPKTRPVVMDATALAGEYDKNKLAAQDKYTGKVVQTTAFIDNISSDIVGSYYLSLKPSNDEYYLGTTIQCYFNDKSALTSLAKGQSVTITGTMQDMSLGIVEMKDCGLVK
jgi:hypothetical protein